MKKNHLITYALTAFCLFTLCAGITYASEYINYQGISMTEEEYTNLVNLGFTEDEIYHMNEETFNLNKDIESSLEVVNQKYYKTIYTNLNGDAYTTEVTEDEYNNQSSMNTRGTLETSYKTMVTTMSRNSDNSFRYKVSLVWKQMPSTRSFDIIGIGFADNVYISSGVYFNYYYANSSGNYTESSAYYNKKQLSTGGSAVYKLPTGDIRALGAVLYFDVKKNNASETITRLDMYGDYAHATANVNQSNVGNYTIHHGGLQLYSSIGGYYDEIPCAQSTWTGTW